MSENKDTLGKRLGLGGVALTVLLSAAVLVLDLLLTVSLSLWFSTYGSEDTKRILETLKVDDVDISAAFTASGGAVRVLSTWYSVVAILVMLLVIVVLWALFYKLCSYYASKALSIYSRITLITALVMIVLSLFSSPVINYYFEDYAKQNDVRFRSFFAVLMISSLVLLVIGILSAIMSLVFSTAEGAPRKKLIDDELLNDSISARDIIEKKKERDKTEQDEALSVNAKKHKKEKKDKKPRVITAAEITPHEEDLLPSQSEKFCSACGSPLKPGALYCGQCGEKVIKS